MKVVFDHVINAATIVLIAVSVTILTQDTRVSLPLDPPSETVKRMMWLAAMSIAFLNVLGPKGPVDKLWVERGFGDKFFPCCNQETSKCRCCEKILPPKRVLAGVLELTALVLQMLDPDVEKTIGKVGFAMLMVMYARGAMIQFQLASVGFFFATIVALICGWILLTEPNAVMAVPEVAVD
mmetsp:Transcript_6224/g.9717  ORF Transcript_6224/g.9717 Transcript_6224/m.9717 type:complete len:181 (+) Transcript_6224:109-651(+)|eukprot:CAMPEP_0178749366 /NCGR_PEP_ID=MMETSP0744-20121128/9369_1 /TAXON_ID=913974 /ORGANISM="Nitzschia punctata, Strain CCMP561" /LENGTH=180 /DNA_ID=CAMNT_0020402769 /DNA_START=66 /DNA_END=608 /DNA_ORIENTATION=+